MDYAIPLPMIWCKADEFSDALTKRQSFNGWRTQYSHCDMKLYTEDQLDVVVGQMDMMAKEIDQLRTANDLLRKQTECMVPVQAPQYVWMVATKTFMALFDTRESAEQAMNSNATASTYMLPVAVPVFSSSLPK